MQEDYSAELIFHLCHFPNNLYLANQVPLHIKYQDFPHSSRLSLLVQNKLLNILSTNCLHSAGFNRRSCAKETQNPQGLHVPDQKGPHDLQVSVSEHYVCGYHRRPHHHHRHLHQSHLCRAVQQVSHLLWMKLSILLNQWLESRVLRICLIRCTNSTQSLSQEINSLLMWIDCSAKVFCTLPYTDSI